MKLLKALKNPHLFFERVLWRLAPYIKDDETYLKWDYYFGMRIVIRNPYWEKTEFKESHHF